MKIHSQQKNTGFTLVETLVAISIFTMSILALFSVLAQGISNTGYAKKKMVASYLAQEGVEYVRNMRDNAVLYTGGGNWASFRDNPLDLASLPSYSDTGFSRSFNKVKITDDRVNISSTVSWTQGSGPYSITFSEDLFNWVE